MAEQELQPLEYSEYAQLFTSKARVTARALFVGQRIDLRAFETTARLAAAPLVVAAGADGCAVLFRYGVAVLFGLDAVEEISFLSGLEPLIVEPLQRMETEDIELISVDDRREGAYQTEINLESFSIERVQLVADVLAKSVVLSYYETRIGKDFDRIDPLAENLRRGGKGGYPGKELLRHIGYTLLTHGKMVGRVEIEEKPELLWEHPELERLYLRLEDEYELRERHTALERKLDLISKTAGTLLELFQHRSTLRVEWYIVILIVVEIFLSLYEMFIRG